jgi:uncharacterized protein YutE (UPF0331/DUF86 family)
LVDRERVVRRLTRLGELIEALEAARAEGPDALEADVRNELAVLHALQLAVQACLDVGAHLVGELGLSPPDDYAGVFRSLSRAGLINSELADRLVEAAGMRNVIVHEYLQVDLDRVWRALERLDDLRDFARAAARAAEVG